MLGINVPFEEHFEHFALGQKKLFQVLGILPQKPVKRK